MFYLYLLRNIIIRQWDKFWCVGTILGYSQVCVSRIWSTKEAGHLAKVCKKSKNIKIIEKQTLT